MKAIAAASLQYHSQDHQGQGNAKGEGKGDGDGEQGGLLLGETVAAGAWVGLAVLLLGGTGGLRRVMRWVPLPVVRGVQVGAGLSLVVAAGTKMLSPLGWLFSPQPDEGGGRMGEIGIGAGAWLDSKLWGVLAFGGLVVTLGLSERAGRGWMGRGRRMPMPTQVPYALVLFLVGLLFAVLRVHLSKYPSEIPPHQPPHDKAPWTSDRIFNPLHHIHFSAVFHSLLSPRALSMALGQLPLTTLNSIIAVSALASDLFPRGSYPQLYDDEPVSMPGAWREDDTEDSGQEGEGPVPLTPLSLSVSLMNLVSAPFGCMPLCHGSGGLAAQHRYGARSGTSIIFLGSIKLLLGLFSPGAGLLRIVYKFPKAFLGVMVLGAGVELARVGVRSVEGSEEDRVVMLMTAGTILAFRNDGVGFLAGMGCYGGYRVAAWIERVRGDGWWGLFGEEEEGSDDEESPLLR